MSKYLVILESPNKIKKVKSFLGKDYEVIASKGHIRDLPDKKIGVDIKKDFAPTYENYVDKKSIIQNIIQKATDSDITYIMTDLDREGEYIAFHIASILPKNINIKRAKAGSITKKAVQEAIDNATCIEQNLVDSAETRRILDRLVGWKCSFVTKQATGGQSAGRVQSATLRILAEREKEIQKFVPKEYWPIEITLETSKGEKFLAEIKSPNKSEIINQKQAETICDNLRNKKVKVSKYETKEVTTKPYAPFTTSTLYQTASMLGWGSKKTASVAQDLYTNGYVTYIRTDSTFIVPEFINEIRDYIPNHYGVNYCATSINSFMNKNNAQEAHEAIRITDINCNMSNLSDDAKLYTMIKKRTIASQASNMVQLKGVAEFEENKNKYIFVSYGSKVIFDGFRKIWDYGKLENTLLPELIIGEELKVIDVKTEQKFTTPPARYTEASIVKQLEKLGIGRPSTYASIIEILLKRKYIENSNKSIQVTDMGIRVSDFLIKTDFCFIDLTFTADLEDKLDSIAHGNNKKIEVLKNFWGRLETDIKKAQQQKDTNTVTEYSCKKCDGKLVLKYSKYGPFLVCQNRLDKEKPCDYKCNANKNGEPVEEVKNELLESDFICNNCGQKLLIRTSKKNTNYLGCRNWKDKKCQGFYDVNTGELIEFQKKTYKKWSKKK